MKAKVNKAKTNRGEMSVPFNMPRNKGNAGPMKMGAMNNGMNKGGNVKKYAKGGGVEQRGKTKGKMC